MKLEAVVVCVDYGDFLAETLPLLIPLVDEVVVVTSLADRETQELCRRLSVLCRPTDLHKKGGDPFNKGRLIDYGLSYLRRDGWVLHVDADTALPPMSRHWLEWTDLDEACIYGVDRLRCPGWAAWTLHKTTAGLQHDFHCRIKVPEGMVLGDRIAIRDQGGYLPIGYFQLWHGKHNRRYPITQGDAEHTDVQHAMQWGPGLRRLIPEILAIHLESEPALLGANWAGRVTARFGPPAPVVVPTPLVGRSG